tara:strand:+ start:141 stop:650 length:510 start_codon:yes stop_codon:yes gene_type:complete
MRIYRITSPNTELVYVGKTIQTLGQRISGHKSDIKRYLSGKTPNLCTSFKVLECGDAIIELIEETDDEGREAHWIRELGACNQRKMEVDWSDLVSVAEYRRKYDHKYKTENRDALRKWKIEKIPCDNCGKVISRNNMQKHKRSKRCLEFVQEPVLGDGANLPLIEQPTV